MKKKSAHIYLYLCAFLFFVACKNKTQTSKTTEKTPIITDTVLLTVLQNNLLLLDEAGPTGKELARLPLGTPLYYLNEISDFTTAMTLNNIAFNDPWLKVRLKDTPNTVGWVYAGAVKFDTKGKGVKLSLALINKRLANFFGASAGRKIEAYQKLYGNAETAEEFAKMFQVGKDLRDSLNLNLNQIDISADFQVPDLFWVDEPLPALQPTHVDSSSVFHLFFNFKELAEKARQTIGEQDDEFVELYLMAYSVDSIEYFYPSWFLKTGEMSGSSLFGEGKHLKMLAQIDKILAHSDFFHLLVQDLKIAIVSDIIANNYYWQPKAQLLKETKEILSANFTCISKADEIALQERLKMFEAPKKYEIHVNQREGGEN